MSNRPEMLKWQRTNPAPFTVYESTTIDRDEHGVNRGSFTIEKRGPEWILFQGFQTVDRFRSLKAAKAEAQYRF